MQWIDTHAHVFVPEFANDLPDVIERARRKGVSRILMPNIDESSFSDMLRVQESYPGFCLPMLGLHPGSVDEHSGAFLERMPQRLAEISYCAIGEIGLDLFWRKDNLEEQLRVFEQQVKMGVEYNLPLVIHSRDSFHHCIRMLKEVRQGLADPERLRGVFHCFTGSVEEANEAMKLGFYLGIGGVVTYKTAKLPEVLKEIGLSKIILETDSPYLPPVPYRGKRNEPAYLFEVASKISEALNIDLKQVSEITTRNANILFTLHHES